ncbi:MAG: hypothetical protein FJX11_14310 [Alphaproteobacteria bacterium]|nr:hypothetical protein [Alphaproteobacteria bacterium]
MNARLTCGLAAALILASGYGLAQTPSSQPAAAAPAASPAASGPKIIGVPTTRRYSTALIVINAKSGRLDGDKLVLDGVQPTATLFTSRPVRTVGHMATPEMAELWRTGSFAKDPPNATASVFAKDGSSVADIVVVLKTAKLDGDKLTFDVHVLEGSLGKADGPTSVFIDTIWFGVGSNGFTYYGKSQTTGGETPAIGDPHGTSTFSGWSNPSPTHPYVPPPRDMGPATAPPPPDYDPRYQRQFNQPTCGKPPLLPCY